MTRPPGAHVERATRGVTFDAGMLIAIERRKSGALALAQRVVGVKVEIVR
jgi:hypothetical protein